MSIRDIGKVRAQQIIDLRTKQGLITLEDVKKLTEVPSTIWDPLMAAGAITFDPTPFYTEDYFREQLESRDRELDELKREYMSAVSRLEERLDDQKKDFMLQLRRYEERDAKMTAELSLKKDTKFESENWSPYTLPWDIASGMITSRKLKTESASTYTFPDAHMVSELAPDGVYKSDSAHHGGYSKTPYSKEIKKLGEKSKKDEDHNKKKKQYDGPAPPKLATFDGKNDWRPYHLQFSRIAGRYSWTEEQSLDKLIECLRDKTLKYFSIRSRTFQQSYRLLCQKMDERFDRKDIPQIISRQLQDLRQNVDESLEEFAESAQELAYDGFPNSPENFIEIVAVDAFLKGCQEKNAAFIATNTDPKTLDEAFHLVKGAMTNYKVIFGAKKHEVRQVTFEEDEACHSSYSTRRINIAADNEKTRLQRMEERWNRTADEVQALKARLEQDVQDIRSKLGNILDIISKRRTPHVLRLRTVLLIPHQDQDPSDALIARGKVTMPKIVLVKTREDIDQHRPV